MISLQSAENALKSFYLDAVKESLDMQTSPLLAMVEKTSENVYGKDVKSVIRVGLHNGFSAGAETGDLPQADQSNYLQMTATLKNLYGTIEISDKAVRAAQSNEGAFVNLLNSEMENLLRSAKYHVGRMVMGNGQGHLAEFQSVAGTKGSLRVSNTAAIMVGMRVKLYTEDMDPYEEGVVRTVKSVDRNSCIVILDGADYPFEINACGFICTESTDDEITGVNSLFDNSEIYGLCYTDYLKIRPVEVDGENEISETKILSVIDRLEEESGTAPDLIVCSWGVRRALLDYYKKNGIPMQTMDVQGGFKAISFNGIPVVADRFAPKHMMYFFNTKDIKLYQLCDWEWMEGDDGKILHQVPGKPVYSATLVKYAELVFQRPNSVARMINIPEL